MPIVRAYFAIGGATSGRLVCLQRLLRKQSRGENLEGKFGEGDLVDNTV
jgi:hypothetical protein